VATQRRTEPVAVSAATFSLMEQPHPTPEQRDERVSLPLDQEAALRALLKVDPGSEPVAQDDGPDLDRRARSAPVVPDATPPRNR